MMVAVEPVQMMYRYGAEPSKKEKGVSTNQADLSQALIEQVADAVIFADREGLIRVWNAGAEAVFGYAADEVLGRRLDVLIPERLRSAHWTGFDEAISTGQTRHGRESMTTRSIHKDGSDLYVDLSFALVKNEAGQVLVSVTIARDTTSRFRAAKESRRRIAELEAQVKSSSSER
jgi:PAS domain S-box-containing protein